LPAKQDLIGRGVLDAHCFEATAQNA
jgi:hypothetical protein